MNLRRLDLNLLVVFEALVAEASVSRAARRLHLTQPALSHALARLRVAFGDPILVRQGRTMHATPRALVALPEVRVLLAQVGRLFTSGGRFDAALAERTIHIGVSDYAALAVLPKVLPRIRREAPSLRFVMHHAGRHDAPALIRSGAMDLALGVFGHMTADISVQTVLEEPYLCATWRGAKRRARPGIADYLAAEHLNVLVRGDSLGLIDEALARRGETRRIVVTVPHFITAAALLRGTGMWLTAPQGLLRRFAREFEMATFRPPLELPLFRTQLAWSRQREDDEGLAWLRARLLAGREGVGAV